MENDRTSKNNWKKLKKAVKVDKDKNRTGNTSTIKARKMERRNHNRRKRKQEKHGYIIRIVIWNIRRKVTVEKKQEMREYKLDVLALQEVTWKGEDKMEKKSYVLFHPKKNLGKNGTAYMISEKLIGEILL